MQTGDQLVHDDWLCEIIIGPRAKGSNSILRAAAACHDQNGCYISSRSQIAKKLETILVGKTEIENNRSVIEDCDRSLGSGDMLRLIAVKSRSRQVLRDKTGKVDVVFNNENPHRPNISTSAEFRNSVFDG